MAFLLSATRETANRFWRHNDLIEVKDRRFESHTKRICASELLTGIAVTGRHKNEPQAEPLGVGSRTFIAGAAGVSGDGMRW